MSNIKTHSSLLIRNSLLSIICIFPSIARSENLPQTQPIDMTAECTKDQYFYYVSATGTGTSKDLATQVALINARKNALICIFGGNVSYQATIDESNIDVETKTTTSVEVSSEHTNWANFELISSFDTESEGAWLVKTKFRWSLKDVEENKKRNNALEKEKEKNRAIAARAETNRKLAEERKVMIESQRAELESLKQQERELTEMASEYDRALKTLKKLKREERSKDQKWINMVLQFGCGVTINDVEAVLGSPDKIEVFGRQKPGTKYYPKYKPLIYFVYGKYALVAPVHGVELDDYKDWSWIKKSAERYQIKELHQYTGGTSAWYICRT